MKNIEVSDEMYEKLMDLSKELNTQNHLATQMPYMFQIKQKVRVPTSSAYADGYEYYNSDQVESFEANSLEELQKIVKEFYENNDMEVPSNFEDFDEGALDAILEREFGYEIAYYKLVDTFENCFLSNKAARKHLEVSRHHYDNPQVYLDYCSNNPEMELVFKFLCELSGGKIHK